MGAHAALDTYRKESPSTEFKERPKETTPAVQKESPKEGFSIINL